MMSPGHLHSVRRPNFRVVFAAVAIDSDELAAAVVEMLRVLHGPLQEEMAGVGFDAYISLLGGNILHVQYVSY